MAKTKRVIKKSKPVIIAEPKEETQDYMVEKKTIYLEPLIPAKQVQPVIIEDKLTIKYVSLPDLLTRDDISHLIVCCKTKDELSIEINSIDNRLLLTAFEKKKMVGKKEFTVKNLINLIKE